MYLKTTLVAGGCSHLGNSTEAEYSRLLSYCCCLGAGAAILGTSVPLCPWPLPVAWPFHPVARVQELPHMSPSPRSIGQINHRPIPYSEGGIIISPFWCEEHNERTRTRGNVEAVLEAGYRTTWQVVATNSKVAEDKPPAATAPTSSAQA